MSIEIYGGIEATTNRVGDTYFQQLDLNGHSYSISDLDLIAELGIKKIRYPALWERLAPQNPSEINWSWLDTRLNRLRELNIEPILGLAHHSSGPRYTSLIDDNFPTHLSIYAGEIAKRYSWINYYTIVNEPLTTARFSCLYSHWYPHLRCNKMFLKALVNQCEATVRAMDAIHQVNPSAKLIQTEDMGKTFATPEMQWQADFENLRRFWSFDLLSGEINNNKSFLDFAQQNEFDKFNLTSVCRPDIMGLNYYVTSSRFLDHEVDLYPKWLRTEKPYIDTESVRVRKDGIPGFAEIINDVWNRYHLPVAMTEVHINDFTLNQIKWFFDAYDDARTCKTNGVDVRAVTTWGMFGLFSWDKLVTSLDGCYESNVFDIRKPYPYKTELFDYIQSLAQNKEYKITDNSLPWWKTSDRFYYGFSR